MDSCQHNQVAQHDQLDNQDQHNQHMIFINCRKPLICVTVGDFLWSNQIKSISRISIHNLINMISRISMLRLKLVDQILCDFLWLNHIESKSMLSFIAQHDQHDPHDFHHLEKIAQYCSTTGSFQYMLCDLLWSNLEHKSTNMQGQISNMSYFKLPSSLKWVDDGIEILWPIIWDILDKGRFQF